MKIVIDKPIPQRSQRRSRVCTVLGGRGLGLEFWILLWWGFTFWIFCCWTWATRGGGPRSRFLVQLLAVPLRWWWWFGPCAWGGMPPCWLNGCMRISIKGKNWKKKSYVHLFSSLYICQSETMVIIGCGLVRKGLLGKHRKWVSSLMKMNVLAMRKAIMDNPDQDSLRTKLKRSELRICELTSNPNHNNTWLSVNFRQCRISVQLPLLDIGGGWE